MPRVRADDLEAIAGQGSELHRKYRLYVQQVTIATAPEGYPGRLERMFASSGWKRLTLFALEAHDLALSKLERNAERDRDDVLRLARAGLLEATTLKTRYEEELRPYLTGNIDWHIAEIKRRLTAFAADGNRGRTADEVSAELK